MTSLVWCLGLLFFLLLEMLVPGGFYFGCLALGCGTAALVTWLGATAGWAWLLCFTATTLGVFLAAPLARRWLRRIPPRPVGYDTLPGQWAQVTEAVDPATGRGMVHLQGAPWLATCDAPVPLDAWVEVLAVSGTRLRVRPLFLAPPTKDK
jgi:membrane protein implicated in regulation of membrane protease activity